ncbi:hypothetical protein Ancab_010885 [Ancistrocladus abbreviatus]
MSVQMLFNALQFAQLSRNLTILSKRTVLLDLEGRSSSVGTRHRIKPWLGNEGGGFPAKHLALPLVSLG